MFRVLLLLSLIASSVVSTEPEDAILSCRRDQKECQNGICVLLRDRCEDTTECSDSEDGTQSCKKRLPRQTNMCVIPPHPDNGIYEVFNEPNARPGQSFESLVLTVNCRRGYGVIEAGAGGNISNRVYCINGKWTQSIPKCVRFCKLDPDPSVRYMCHVPGTSGFKVCDKYVAPGTSVSPLCNTPIYYSPESLLYMKCTAGSWDYIAKCKAECGRVTPEGEQLIVNGTTAKRGELPWHVGIYRKAYNPYKQVCGGTLISNAVVVSAAHCFWHDVKKRLPASDFAVAIGKLQRPWNDSTDIGAQKSDVKVINIPHLFEGEAANFQEDIAIVILATPFVYKTYVRPVCLNFDGNFDRWQLQQGKLGKVAGWGLTKANGSPSKTLKVVELPYVSIDTCISALPQSFREYITGDKFCAGYTNGTALCKGDSGGGLAFPDKELGIDRYYLRGIVSVAAKDEDNICNDKVYTVFTKITKHEEFIKRSVAASAKKSCASYQFQCADGGCVDVGAECNGVHDCADGSDETDYLCKPETSNTSVQQLSDACILPPYPAHGTYKVANAPDASPGQSHPSFVLSVTCDEGYGIPAGTDGKSHLVYCANGAWYQNMVNCVRYCKVQPDPSIRFISCQIPGTNSFTSCEGYVPPGTSAIPTCNTPNYSSNEALPFMTCVNGSWNYNAKCPPECGRVTPQGEALAIGGVPAQRGEIPWHAGVYTKATKPYMLICSGALVSTDVVISAAHCFWNLDHVESPSMYAVAVGKIYKPFNAKDDPDAQKSDLKKINIPSRYQDLHANYQGDIAVLIMATPFVYKTYIRPVCVDFNKKFERKQLLETIGKVAGWGLTSANGSPSPVLITVQLPYVDVNTCIKEMKPGFRPFITLDKFCAGYNNGTAALCKGDTGGGLSFPHTENGVERYYVRGMVSVAPIFEGQCNPNTYIGFTKISSHEDFLSEYLDTK